ncbi:MAG: twin-arginine translocation signal domain-containing protein [Armatimonadota bacterium]
MDRRKFLKATGLTAALGAVGTAEAQTPAVTTAASVPTFQFVGAPVLQNLTGDGVTIVWVVNGNSTGWVEYGETPEFGSKNDGVDGGLRPRTARCLRSA